MVEMLTKGNEKVFEDSTKEIQALEKTITDMNKKAEKLRAEVTMFMDDFLKALLIRTLKKQTKLL